MYGWADNGHYRIEKKENQRSYSLQGYLDIGMKMRDKIRRVVTEEDLKTIHELKAKAQDMNVLIADTLTVISVLRQIGDKQVYAVTNNLFRIVISMQRQRELIYATLECFKRLKPEEYEKEYIADLCKRIAKRKLFIRDKILPENISLTPIVEYLEEVGSENLSEDVFKVIGTRRELAELLRSGKQEEAIKAYARRIMDVVNKAGRGDAYKERVATWYERSERIRADREAELKTKKHMAELELAEEGLVRVRNALQYAVRELSGRNDIGCPLQTLHKRLAEGARGKWVLLRCETVRCKPVKRYYTDEGEWGNRFIQAKLFKSENECRNVMKAEKARGPWKAYDCMMI